MVWSSLVWRKVSVLELHNPVFICAYNLITSLPYTPPSPCWNSQKKHLENFRNMNMSKYSWASKGVAVWGRVRLIPAAAAREDRKLHGAQGGVAEPLQKGFSTTKSIPIFPSATAPCLIRDRNIPPGILNLHCVSFCCGNPFKFSAFPFQNVSILNEKWSKTTNPTENAEHFPFSDASVCCKFSATDLVVILTAAWFQPCWYIGYFYIWEAICVTDFAIHAACWRTSLRADLRAVFSRWKQLDRSTFLKRGNSITFFSPLNCLLKPIGRVIGRNETGKNWWDSHVSVQH